MHALYGIARPCPARVRFSPQLMHRRSFVYDVKEAQDVCAVPTAHITHLGLPRRGRHNAP